MKHQVGILLVLVVGCGSQEDAPLPAEEAARTMVVPDGFEVTLFAGEPDVKQPIAFCIDDRGRLWVAEAYNYPHHGTRPGDRILIFEDEDGDGRFDKRTVFYDTLNYVSGIEVGFGGAWVMSPPYFYFIPDQDGDDKPDGEPRVLLDGFGNHANAHNIANGFAWGPDGWLYGTHGRTNWSMLGTPGTPEKERKRFDGGVWRYHPVRHVWEPYADGTTNPWGIDWNDYGESFICNCVNPHLFHVIPGAHYEPWRNRESSRHAYERIPTIADHLHFVGSGNVREGLGTSAEDEAGGGHAHCGTMVYLGDNWPERYRNSIFMNNIHGRRINNDLLRRKGSGYTASHGKDLMRSRDLWYMGVTLAYGPDGSVYASDWSDTGECHSVRNTRKHTGRIYRISYGRPEKREVDVSGLGNDELVKLQLHRNDWFVRHGRRVLAERAAVGDEMTGVHRQLKAMYAAQDDVTRKLRALWALHVTGGLDERFLVAQLDDENEYIRAWALRLLCEDGELPVEALAKFRELAVEGDSAYVRLHLASNLQRLKFEDRWEIAEALAGRTVDANDDNLPLMLWYGVEPLVAADLERFVRLAVGAEIPLIRRHIARRVVLSDDSSRALELIVRLLPEINNASRGDLLTGVLKGLEGRRTVKMPVGWPAVFAELQNLDEEKLRKQVLRLALIFDDPAALVFLKEQAMDTEVAATSRKWAVEALVAKKPKDLVPLLLNLMGDKATRGAALLGLAEYDDEKVAGRIIGSYGAFDEESKQFAIQTLASRKAWAHEMLDAVQAKTIARGDLSAYTARQLQSLGDVRLIDRVKSIWGEVRATPADRRKRIAYYRKRLTPEALARADAAAGRVVFEKTCAKCHKYFGKGGTIGPDITGSQRKNVDYLLENLIDPSAAVSKDFQMEILVTESGRVITGLIVDENNKAVTIQTVNEKIVLPADEIETRAKSKVSMMPEGMLKPLSVEDVRNLFAYLWSSGL